MNHIIAIDGRRSWYQHAHSRELYLGQRVMAQGPPPQLQWLPGTIIQQTGPVSYVIKITDGRLWKRHADQIRGMLDSPENSSTQPSWNSHL